MAKTTSFRWALLSRVFHCAALFSPCCHAKTFIKFSSVFHSLGEIKVFQVDQKIFFFFYKDDKSWTGVEVAPGGIDFHVGAVSTWITNSKKNDPSNHALMLIRK